LHTTLKIRNKELVARRAAHRMIVSALSGHLASKGFAIAYCFRATIDTTSAHNETSADEAATNNIAVFVILA
jgi:hypothetical protein